MSGRVRIVGSSPPTFPPKGDFLAYYALDDLYDADQTLRTAKERIAARQKREMQSELQELRDERDKIAYQVFRAGVSKLQIANKGLSTKATVTAYAAIQRGAELLGVDLEQNPVVGEAYGRHAKQRPEPASNRFAWIRAGQLFEVTLGDTDYNRAREQVGVLPIRTASFVVDDTGFVAPSALDLSVPAVWLYLADSEFQSAVKGLLHG